MVLTPMMVQYLVGLCCLRHNPDAVEITVGDMVYDRAAQKKRDVDVTITLKNEDGTISAFKAAEVKKEATPLDVTTIEQLCMKFSDMPQVTHKSIFSTSGYSQAAKTKAQYHGVDIYTLKPWKRRIEFDFPDFNGVGTPSEFLARVDACILRWLQYNVYVVVPGGPTSFHWNNNTPIFTTNGTKHSNYVNMGQYIEEVVRRSADILCTLEPMFSIAENLIHSARENVEYSISPAFNHSQSFSGVILEDEIQPLKDLMEGANSFRCEHIDFYEEYLDVSDEEYRELLESKRNEIGNVILNYCRSKRANMYLTGPVSLDIAERVAPRRVGDNGTPNKAAVQFVGGLIAQMVRQGQLVTAETDNGLGIRTATESERRVRSLKESGPAGNMTIQGW